MASKKIFLEKCTQNVKNMGKYVRKKKKHVKEKKYLRKNIGEKTHCEISGLLCEKMQV